jgi:hypothetical protein
MQFIEHNLLLLVGAMVLSYVLAIVSLIFSTVINDRKSTARAISALFAMVLGLALLGGAVVSKVCCVISIVLKVISYAKG